MLARRVCRRDPLPRRVEEICGKGPELASGEESTPERREWLEGERASEGRGCSERGTLNADRKANGNGAGLFDGLPLRRSDCRGFAGTGLDWPDVARSWMTVVDIDGTERLSVAPMISPSP